MCSDCASLRSEIASLRQELAEWRAFAEGDADEEARIRAPVRFTTQQWRLLTTLIRAGGRPLRADYLSSLIRVGNGEGDRLVDPVLCFIRRILEAARWPRDTISTTRGTGAGGYYIARETIPGFAAWLGIEQMRRA